MARPRVLVAEDEDRILDLFRGTLSEQFEVVTASDGRRALDLGLKDHFDVVVSDLRVPGMDAFALLRELKRANPDVEVVVLTANSTSPNALQALQEGAYGYLRDPFEPQEALLTIERALERKSLRELARRSRGMPASVEKLDHVVGKSAAMQAVHELLARASASDAAALITGEAGTGKELAARTVHAMSARCSGPFVPVACGAMAAHAIEPELFGYGQGAFAGAEGDRPGLFEEAHGGTLYLDAVEALPPSTQVKVGRVLQVHAVRRVGETFERQVSTRVIAGTHADLDAAVQAGTFRADLLYRLRVLSIRMPALRERWSDIPALASSFLERHAAGHGRRVDGFTHEALAALIRYPWPGNVRELEYAIERALAVNQESRISLEALPEEVANGDRSRVAAAELGNLGYREAVALARDRASREYLAALMREQGGSVTRAAERAGMERETLHRLLKRFGLHSEDFRRR